MVKVIWSMTFGQGHMVKDILSDSYGAEYYWAGDVWAEGENGKFQPRPQVTSLIQIANDN